MTNQPLSYPSSEDGLHVREPSYRGIYDRSNQQSYGHVSSSDWKPAQLLCLQESGRNRYRMASRPSFRP
ncbi:hypothetical protein GB937_009981 [Aspergillus fischeri]|nr:hypothetical protein GB937_009981 [Aspergillus fischeri]